MAVLKDVAKMAGVGLSTASYVINGTGLHKVSAETRERVLAVARKLRYQPNIAGRALNKGRTYIIGALFPDITGSFTGEILQGIGDTLNEVQYSMLFSTYSGAEDYEKKLYQLAEKQIDGMILFPYFHVDSLNFRKPVVLVAKNFKNCPYPSIYVDGARINELAVSHLLEMGHRNILVQASYDEARQRGAQTAVRRYPGAKLQFAPPAMMNGADVLDYGMKLRVRPTAYLMIGDKQGAELISHAADLGLAVPDDVSVMGVDCDLLGECVRPALTTIRQPRREQGVEAAKLLLKKINGEESPHAVLEPELVIRRSVKRLKQTLRERGGK